MITPCLADRRRVAIVGGGISGLVCAYALHPSREVTLFEANTYIGGHTRTVDVPDYARTVGVDTGFIVYNEQNYPNFTALLARLGVRTKPSDMSLSVRCDRSGVEYNGSSLNKLFAQRSNLRKPSHYRMIADILRFFREAPRVLESDDERTTVEEYAAREGYGSAFLDRYLVPIGASLWSCPPGTFRGFPIRFVVDFFQNHGMLLSSGRPQWRVIEGGSTRYVEALIASFHDQIRLGTPVVRVERSSDHVELTTAGGDRARFDHVIFACHSDQALKMLADPTQAEREILGAIPYERNDVTLHTDETLLPRRRRAWGSWNYHTRDDGDRASTVTYNMNMLQSLKTHATHCVTLNERDMIRDDRVLGEYEYSHPVFSASRVDAQDRRSEIQGINRSSYCGAYWGYGFHEDGVRSALDVCASFGASL